MFRFKTLLIGLALVSAVVLIASAGAQKIMSVQVREGQLRATPSHFGKIVARASYGDQTTVLEETGDWEKVSIMGGKVQGWMHVTALTSKRIVLKAGQSNVETSVSQGEIALAGKGFNKEVEAEYRKSNANLDFDWINRMEAMKVSSEQMDYFIADGRLATRSPGGNP